jgi:GT2 family glycosyltransferase
MKNNPLVSIVILNYNGERFLDKCLSSVLKTDYPNFEVILVDNGSTDGSLRSAVETFANDARLKIVRNAKNLGFGPGNNVGFEHSLGDYVVFLNNDTFVDSSWLEQLVDAMEKDRTIGLAQCTILDAKSKEVQNIGWLISDYCVFLYPIRLANFCGQRIPDTFEVSYVSGAAMVIRRDLAKDIGLFDPKYFWFYDDTYLSFKTWLAGKRVVTVSRSKIYHVGSATSGVGTFFILSRNAICLISLIFDIYAGFVNLMKALFIYYFNLGIVSFKDFVENKRTTRVWANTYAICWTLRNLKYIWRNRLKYWRKARIDESTLLLKMSRIHIPASVYLVPPPVKLLPLFYQNETRKYQIS